MGRSLLDLASCSETKKSSDDGLRSRRFNYLKSSSGKELGEDHPG